MQFRGRPLDFTKLAHVVSIAVHPFLNPRRSQTVLRVSVGRLIEFTLAPKSYQFFCVHSCVDVLVAPTGTNESRLTQDATTRSARPSKANSNSPTKNSAVKPNECGNYTDKLTDHYILRFWKLLPTICRVLSTYRCNSHECTPRAKRQALRASDSFIIFVPLRCKPIGFLR